MYKSKSIHTASRFRLYSVVLGLAIGYILFLLNSYSSSSTSKAISNFYRFNPHTRGANPYDYKTTLDRLNTYFPYDNSPRRIDKNIIQMWKVPPTDPDFPHRDLVATWKNENPTYKYNLYTDDEIHELLVMHFANTVPEVVEAFDLMPNKIIQSDFSRYLLIFLYGGLYTDLDTKMQKPVDTWFDSDRNVGFVVAVEEDMNVENWEHYMTRRLQFEQWTFKAKPRHPILKKLIAKIVETTFNAAKNHKLQAYYKDFHGVDRCDSIDIMEWTGPVVWTDTIYGHMNSLSNPTIVDIDSSRNIYGELYGPEDDSNNLITWKFFTGLIAPVMVDDVVIYPKLSFREDNQNNCGKYCYVFHEFGGSWKNNGKGEIKAPQEGEGENNENNGNAESKEENNENKENENKEKVKREVPQKECAHPYKPL